MPVYKLLDEMPYEELIKWVNYFKNKPIGWQEDYRTFLLMKSFGAKGNAEDYFPSIRIIKENEEKFKAEQAGRVAPSGKFLSLMKKARTGDSNTSFWEK